MSCNTLCAYLPIGIIANSARVSCSKVTTVSEQKLDCTFSYPELVSKVINTIKQIHSVS